jgi:hypothetical protein
MDDQSKQGAPIAPPTPVEAPKEASIAPVADPRIEQLARRERAIRQQHKAFQAEKAQFESERAKLMDPQGWKQKFLQDPGSVGLTYEEIAGRYLNQPSPEDQKVAALERKIAELEGKQSEAVSKVETAQKAAYDQAIKQISREVNLLVDGNDAYETIKATSSQDAVTALIESTYKEDGILISTEEAARQVEEYLLEEALKYAQLNKVKAKLAPPAKEEAAASSPEDKTNPQKPTITTLSRTATQPAAKPLSAKEKRERAILAFQGKLN